LGGRGEEDVPFDLYDFQLLCKLDKLLRRLFMSAGEEVDGGRNGERQLALKGS
jgi:hypothetical protein